MIYVGGAMEEDLLICGRGVVVIQAVRRLIYLYLTLL
jgi:hypothetical protein